MIFIIGGAYQGKEAFAKKLLGNSAAESTWADGRVVPLSHISEYQVITHFHEAIRRMMQEQMNPESVIHELLLEKPSMVFLMDEIGYGVVPMDAQDREYREAVGHAGQLLARHAKQVYRVICGIGTPIK